MNNFKTLVLNYHMQQTGVSAAEAEDRWIAMNQTFNLCKKTKREQVLPEPADKLLHDTLQFTEGYKGFCLESFGTMIHHKPATIPGHPSGYLKTRELAEASFGPLNTSAWPVGERPQWSVVYFEKYV